MLINVTPPPLPGFVGFNDTAALCPSGIGGISGDPFGITDVLGIVSNLFIANKQQKIQKQQIAVQNAALTQQKVVDAQNFAANQAITLAAPTEQQRQSQVYGLLGIGAAAVVVAGLLIYGAVRK